SAESELADLFLQGETLTAKAAEFNERRTAARADRVAAAHVAHQHRTAIHTFEEQLHERELAAGEIGHPRGAVESRLREDYGIDLAELAQQPERESEQQSDTPPPQSREEIDGEISDLRRKLTNIGGVNLDSLAEVEELETRFQTLSVQHDDLSKAKES